MATKTPKGLRTWIEVDRKAIKNNYGQFRKLIPKSCKLCSVVKSNAYGHGLVDFSKEVVSLGADWLAVDSVVEATRLRDEGIQIPILVLGFTLPEMIQSAREKDISITVSSFESLNTLSKLSKTKEQKLKIHIKIDSGMYRQGFVEVDQKKVVEILKKNKDFLEVEGLCTHFASAKNPAFPADTNKQIVIFKKWRASFQKAGFKTITHASATSGAILFPEAHFDMVRIGIGMYGMWPSVEVREFAKRKVKLEPVLSWKTLISEIKKLPAGTRVGYDFTETLKRKSTVAICPIGYWHGYFRSLSSIGEVLVRGKRAKIIGRVSMDMITVDITDIPDAKVLDEVVLLGRSQKDCISTEDIAFISGTNHYEFVTRINPLIKKIYL
ncbi:MAG: alanine racemase [Parcubacteria group bacterium]|nr:alanine racemase [Parcubacteria group bacterium]